eukprot:Pgem_evm1s3318
MNCFICAEEFNNNNEKVTVECCQQHLCYTCLKKLDQCPFCNNPFFVENEERRKFNEIAESRTSDIEWVIVNKESKLIFLTLLEMEIEPSEFKSLFDNYLECLARPVDFDNLDWPDFQFDYLFEF